MKRSLFQMKSPTAALSLPFSPGDSVLAKRPVSVSPPFDIGTTHWSVTVTSV